jgi:2-oxoglutarate dehydrogenase E2 component (dihydrolipoamide succinyltransferase)
MSVEILVPPLGESLVDAVVGEWLKQPGDAVSRGETVVLLETDKVNLDVTAEEDGVLSRIDKQAGEVVTVGEVLGVVGEGAAAAAPNGAAAAEAVPAASREPAAEPVAAASAPVAAAAAEPPAPAAAPVASPVASDDGGRAAPAVRRMAEEHGVDLATVSGSGLGGRVTREDVLLAAARSGALGGVAAPAAPAAAPSPAPAAPVAASSTAPAAPAAPAAEQDREERIKLSRRQQTIAVRLVEAQQTAAMLTTFNEVDMAAVMEIRSRRKESFKEANGVGLGFMSFFTKAVVGALKAHPRVNAELQGDVLVLKKHYDIGIAVGLDEGVVVPVVRDADRKSFAEIEREIADMAGRARDNKLTLAELQGGTFSITNGGIYGSLMSTPILSYPQVGILGMHAIQQRPVARDGEVVIRPMMYTALSYDHRVVDGKDAVQFLVKLKNLLEDPELLMLEG